MPVCQYCGRQLADGEVCHCQEQQPSPYMNQSGQPDPQGIPVQPQYPQYPQNQPFPNANPQPFPNAQYPYPNPQDPYQNLYRQGQQPQKKGAPVGCIIAAAVGIPVFLGICGVLAAILVPATLGYLKKSRVASANAEAKNVQRAVTSALTELDEMDVDLEGIYIVSSDESRDLAIPFEAEMLHDRIGYFYTTGEDVQYEYFAVIEDGVCTYAAAWNPEHEIVGAAPYPSDTDEAYDCDGDPVEYTHGAENEVYDALYEIASDEVIFYSYDYYDDEEAQWS